MFLQHSFTMARFTRDLMPPRLSHTKRTRSVSACPHDFRDGLAFEGAIEAGLTKSAINPTEINMELDAQLNFIVLDLGKEKKVEA